MNIRSLGMRSFGIRCSLALALAVGVAAIGAPAAVAGNGAMAVDCDASTTGVVDTACSYGNGASFTAAVHVTTIPAGNSPSADGYIGLNTALTWTDANITYVPTALPADEITWPDKFGFNLRLGSGAWIGHGDATALFPPFPVSTHSTGSPSPPLTSGEVVKLNFTCGTDVMSPIDQIPYLDPPAGTGGASFKLENNDTVIPAVANATVTCGTPGPSGPDPPTFSTTDPASPANNNSPKIKGSAEAGSTVRLYTTSDCSGTPEVTGSAADFASTGLTVAVADDSTTPFYGTAEDTSNILSSCSFGSPFGSIEYVEDSTASPPTLTATAPVSPANENSPKIKGTAEAGSTVTLYTNATCTSGVAATGSSGAFASPGLTVAVGDDSTTTFYGKIQDQVGNVSGCSSSSIAYTEDSTAPAEPTLTATAPVSPANDNSPKIKGTA
ncbi:hypothetical protein LCGC14_2231960, partial [marine sediment metagenome]